MEYNFIAFGNGNESSNCVSDHFIINICNCNVLIDIVVVDFVVSLCFDWFYGIPIFYIAKGGKNPFPTQKNTIIHARPSCENKVWTTFIHNCNYL